MKREMLEYHKGIVNLNLERSGWAAKEWVALLEILGIKGLEGGPVAGEWRTSEDAFNYGKQ